MQFEDRLIIAFVSALLGFLLSQTFNFIKFWSRPKLQVYLDHGGIVESYTGNPPETPAYLVYGFYIRNTGRNPARNIRVFVSDVEGRKQKEGENEELIPHFFELRRPINILPSGESIPMKVGEISSSSSQMSFFLEDRKRRSEIDYLEADTRNRIFFDMTLHVVCDDMFGSKKSILSFAPTDGELATIAP